MVMLDIFYNFPAIFCELEMFVNLYNKFIDLFWEFTDSLDKKKSFTVHKYLKNIFFYYQHIFYIL